MSELLSDAARQQRRHADADDSWRRTPAINFDGVSAGETDDSLGRCRPAQARAIVDAIKLLPAEMREQAWQAAIAKGTTRAVIESEAKTAKSTNIIRKNAADAAQQLQEWGIEIPHDVAPRRRLMQTLIDLRKKKDFVVEKEDFRRALDALDQNASLSQPFLSPGSADSLAKTDPIRGRDADEPLFQPPIPNISSEPVEPQPLEHVPYLAGSDDEEEGEVEEEWAEGDGPWLVDDMHHKDWNSERLIPCANQIFKSTSM